MSGRAQPAPTMQGAQSRSEAYFGDVDSYGALYLKEVYGFYRGLSPRNARLDAYGFLHHIMLKKINKSVISTDDQERFARVRTSLKHDLQIHRTFHFFHLSFGEKINLQRSARARARVPDWQFGVFSAYPGFRPGEGATENRRGG